jgi:hypothetical protein
MIRFILSFAAVVVGQFTFASGAVFPLKIADNGRYLVGQDGKPFLVVGDTAWSLIVQPGEADIDRYLEDPQRQGFNAIIVNLIEHKFCTVPPKTRSRGADAINLTHPSPDFVETFGHEPEKIAQDGRLTPLPVGNDRAVHRIPRPGMGRSGPRQPHAS